MNGPLTATSTRSARATTTKRTPRNTAPPGNTCINAVTLPSGEKVGYLFGELTAVGVEYVKEAVAEAQEGLGSKEVTDLWQEHYRDKGYDL